MMRIIRNMDGGLRRFIFFRVDFEGLEGFKGFKGLKGLKGLKGIRT